MDTQLLVEKAKIPFAALVGLSGITLPTLIDIGNAFEALTFIFSFFFIVLPTGIWATYRAWDTIKKRIKK